MSDVLVDGDLTLRRAVPADAADIREVYNEADIQLWMLWEPEKSRRGRGAGEHRAVRGGLGRGLQRAFPDRRRRARRRRGEPQLPRTTRSREIAYFLRTSARGRGLATRAVLLASDWGFRERGLARIQLRVDPDQPRVGRPGRACRVHLRGCRAQLGGLPRRPPLRLPGLLAAAERTGGDPPGHLGRRRVPDRHGDHRHRGAGALPRRRRPRGVPGRLPRLDSRAAARHVAGSTTSVVTAYGADVGRLRVVRTADTRRAGRPPAASCPPGQGDRHPGHPRPDGRGASRAAARSGCRSRRTTRGPRRCTSGSGWSSSARMATST